MMADFDYLNLPGVLKGITSTTEDLELTMGADMRFGSLLRTLAASSLGAEALQLGAGSGLLTAWLLDGLPRDGRLLACEADPELHGVVRRFLGRDGRLELRAESPEELLGGSGRTWSLIVAGSPLTVAGQADRLLHALSPGGMLVVGGMAPAEGRRPAEHTAADQLAAELQALPELRTSLLDEAPGVLLASHAAGR